jgi:XTP/dITP diphosphohydrolase
MSKPKLTVVTGNLGKWQICQNTIGHLFQLTQSKLETPEIQSLDVVEVASYSAKWAAQHLGTPVLKSDVGYDIATLNGFPGPLVKWVNQTLTPEHILSLLRDNPNRAITIREALAYAEPNGWSAVITIERQGVIQENILSAPAPSRSIFDKIVLEHGQPSPWAEQPLTAQITHLSNLYRTPYQTFAQTILKHINNNT